SSVLSVVLYQYASEGKVVQGFKEEHLKNAFVQPIIYVLATEAPGPNYRPLEDVKVEAASFTAPAVKSNEAPETAAADETLAEPELPASEAPVIAQAIDNAPLASKEIAEVPSDPGTDKV